VNICSNSGGARLVPLDLSFVVNLLGFKTSGPRFCALVRDVAELLVKASSKRSALTANR
jgi:hypothetical protein